ncbi:hypothetical protein [Paucibacter sp. PLA-PC-4]
MQAQTVQTKIEALSLNITVLKVPPSGTDAPEKSGLQALNATRSAH